MYTVIRCNATQAEKLFRKHMWWKLASFYIPYYDNPKRGYVTVLTITGKTIIYQLSEDNEVSFVKFTGFYDIKYDVRSPNTLCPGMSKKLKSWCVKSKKRFLKGGYIY